MYPYSKSSLDKLATCDVRLQKVFSIVAQVMDCTIICGHREEEEQNRAYAIGKSQLQYPDSTHNSKPSKGVDAAPYPIDWNGINDFYKLAGLVLGIAECLGIKIKWGGDFKSLKDYCHFEIIE